jgi:hypothetical protein
MTPHFLLEVSNKGETIERGHITGYTIQEKLCNNNNIWNFLRQAAQFWDIADEVAQE